MNQHIYWGEFIVPFYRSIPIVIDWETSRQKFSEAGGIAGVVVIPRRSSPALRGNRA